MKYLIAIMFLLFSTSVNANVREFGYQLQNVNIEEIEKSTLPIVIIDTEGKNGRWTKEEITRMKSNNKKLLAYVSLGEAENYRWYWKKEWETNPPKWLGKVNPDWEGNYSIKEWFHPDWLEVVYNYLHYITEVGFDGIYIDKVDVYEDLGGSEAIKNVRKNSMIRFVNMVSVYAKDLKNSFLIIPQNAIDLTLDDVYMKSIDGVGREDLLFGENVDGEKNSRDSIQKSLIILFRLQFNNKLVLITEYIPKDIGEAYKKALQESGFSVLLAERELNKLE